MALEEEEQDVLGPSQRIAADDCCFGDDASARVVLWGLVRASSERHQPPGCRAENTTVCAEVAHGGGAGGGGMEPATAPSWQFREGVLLVYVGVLKHLVEARVASEIASGGGGGGGGAEGGPFPPTTAHHDDRNDDDDGEERCRRVEEWPAELLRSTPSLGELLPPLLTEAEHALGEADLMMRSMPLSALSHSQKHPGNQHGSLELWRAGSQLLPAVARAMVWWNPGAIFR